MTLRIFLTLLATLAFVIMLTYWLQQTPTRPAHRHNFWRRGIHRSLRLFNPLLRRLGLTPLWLLPAGDSEMVHILDNIRALRLSIRQTVHANPYIDAAKAQALTLQVEHIPENVVALSWKLHRLQNLQDLIAADSVNAQDLETLRTRLRNEIQRAAQSLENISVSLIKLELADNEDVTAQLLDDLAQANQRMQDLLRAREQVKRG
jgi:hypothetical protein